MDFSSSQPLSSFSSRGFDASSFSRSSGPADLARFRTPASKLNNICVKYLEQIFSNRALDKESVYSAERL